VARTAKSTRPEHEQLQRAARKRLFAVSMEAAARSSRPAVRRRRSSTSRRPAPTRRRLAIVEASIQLARVRLIRRKTPRPSASTRSCSSSTATSRSKARGSSTCPERDRRVAGGPGTGALRGHEEAAAAMLADARRAGTATRCSGSSGSIRTASAARRRSSRRPAHAKTAAHETSRSGRCGSSCANAPTRQRSPRPTRGWCGRSRRRATPRAPARCSGAWLRLFPDARVEERRPAGHREGVRGEAAQERRLRARAGRTCRARRLHAEAKLVHAVDKELPGRRGAAPDAWAPPPGARTSSCCTIAGPTVDGVKALEDKNGGEVWRYSSSSPRSASPASSRRRWSWPTTTR
jgi:hypothetical protein